ncbi:MAG: fumarylacetoacetate hydrolase family protein [Candidatus Competibacterales bacterium]|nr:fumarylacetoacetate hydrolase family protein [Candidatus Competibacterales bacterium]
MATAYTIQDAVAARLWPGAITAWKTGAKAPDAEPIAAPILQPLIFHGDTELPGSDFQHRGIEGELAYRLGQDLPLKEAPYSKHDLREAISAIHPAIEIVDSRLSDWEQAGPLWKLADNQINGALVVGPAVSDWRAVKPTKQPVELHVDGESVVSATGGNPAGDPIRLLVWMANHCAARGYSLSAGTLITTGSCTGLRFVGPDSTAKVIFAGLGTVTVSFTAD